MANIIKNFIKKHKIKILILIVISIILVISLIGLPENIATGTQSISQHGGAYWILPWIKK